MQELVLASGNPGKLKEFQELLADCGYQVRSQGEFGLDSAEETGLTFVENAILKARHASAQTGRPALADDSGLSVDALEGRPGIYSARYAGPEATDTDNNARLLQELEGVPEAERGACYHCVLVLLQHANDPTPVIAQGHWHGRIRTEAKGEGGFGYDPLFQVLEHNCSAAELSKAEKSQISHRAIATRALMSRLTDHSL